MSDYPINIGPNNPDYVVKNIEVTINVPTHPAMLTILVDCLEKINETALNLAIRDCNLNQDDPPSELLVKAAEGYQGDFMSAEAWARCIAEISSIANEMDRAAASEWIEFFGDDHPMSKLTKMTFEKSQSNANEFFSEMKEVAIGINSDCYDDDEVVAANIKNAESPEEVLMVLKAASTR